MSFIQDQLRGVFTLLPPAAALSCDSAAEVKPPSTRKLVKRMLNLIIKKKEAEIAGWGRSGGGGLGNRRINQPSDSAESLQRWEIR